MLRVSRHRDPKIFKLSEEKARQGDLGKLTYWKAGDKPGQVTKTAREQPDPAKKAKAEREMAKHLEKVEKAKEKEGVNDKQKDKKTDTKKDTKKDKRKSVLGVSELIRGSAHVGGSVGDVGEALRRNSRDSAST